MASMVVLIIIIIMAVFGPIVSPYSYDATDFGGMLQGPSFQHPLGTDDLGRDILIRILYGARISLTIGSVAALINMVIGALNGGIAG